MLREEPAESRWSQHFFHHILGKTDDFIPLSRDEIGPLRKAQRFPEKGGHTEPVRHTSHGGCKGQMKKSVHRKDFPERSRSQGSEERKPQHRIGPFFMIHRTHLFKW